MNQYQRETLEAVFAKPDFKDWDGAYPELDFVDGVFTGDNWNDARLGFLRACLASVEISAKPIELDVADDTWFIFRNVYEDQHYVFIVAGESLYHIEWYKSRGRTEKVNLDGKPVTLDQFRRLCEALASIYPTRRSKVRPVA